MDFAADFLAPPHPCGFPTRLPVALLPRLYLAFVSTPLRCPSASGLRPLPSLPLSRARLSLCRPRRLRVGVMRGHG